jgi:hypothetical protein
VNVKKMPNKNTKTNNAHSNAGRKKMTGRKAAKEKNPVMQMTSKMKAPQKLKAVSRRVGKIEPETIAKGAAVVSIAAGVVAAGAMMADKKNREKAGKAAVKGMDFIKEVASNVNEEAMGKYQAVQMTVPLKRSSKKSNKGRSKKS